MQDLNRKGCELFKNIAKTNCNDPQFASSSPICICQRNPNDPQCGGIYQKNNMSLTPSTGLGDGGNNETVASSGGSSLTGEGFGGGEDFEPNSKYMSSGDSPSSQLAGGGGGFGGLGGHGGRPLNEPYQKPVAQKALSRLNANVIGRSSGGGFLSAVRSALGLSNQMSNRDLNVNENIKQDQKQKDLPDLTQFLPGGMRDPRRRLSSATGPDGITGPYSDNFKKVNLRYVSLGTTFK
jgi:hypothetical protein